MKLVWLRMVWSALLLTAAAAGADDGGPPRSGTARPLGEDENLDGVITLAEAYASALRMFNDFDVNRDARVTAAELAERAAGWRRRRFDARFVALDRSRDGVLAASEIRLPARRFAWLDRDRNGALSPAELWAPHGGPRGPTDTAALRSRFWRRDRDHDGRVTRAEVLTFAEQRFQRRDRNHDGVLAGEEVAATDPVR